MDIVNYIPDSSSKWIVKNETIYYQKGGLIPVLKRIDDTTFISLDRRITKQVIKIIEKLNSIEEPFLLCDRLTITEKHIYREDLPRIIENYLYSLSDETFFKFLKKGTFDYINNLTSFLNTYNSHKLFKVSYENLKRNHYHKKWMDWYTRKDNWQIKNEEIRDYYSTIERQVKLNIFFS